jgi:hypothetical protein
VQFDRVALGFGVGISSELDAETEVHAVGNTEGVMNGQSDIVHSAALLAQVC